MTTPQRPADAIAERAASLRHARAAHLTIDPFATLGELTMDDAYAIQELLTADRLAAGERIVGWKLGYTSAVMRAQMGVAQPNFGPLTDAMLLADGATVPEALVQPRVEPEIALRFARPLRASGRSVTREAVLAAVESAVVCLEVVHSTWVDYRFRIEHNTADGSSAAFVVVGEPLGTESLDAIEVDLLVDGQPAGHGQGADANGHPADGVIWLLDQLASRGRGLEEGDLVITGGLTAAAVLGHGSTIVGHFHGGPLATAVEVSVRRS